MTYFVRARDAAGNQSGNSNTVTRTGTVADTQAPTAPGNLAYTQPAAGQIRLTWNASTDNVGVTGYDVYANGSAARPASAAPCSPTPTPSRPPRPCRTTCGPRTPPATSSGNSNTVTRTGTGGRGHEPGRRQADHRARLVRAHVRRHERQRRQRHHLLGGRAGAYPSTLTVALGANATISTVVLKLNPDSAWGTRTQTIQVLGREQSSSTFTNLVAAATYTLQPGDRQHA